MDDDTVRGQLEPDFGIFLQFPDSAMGECPCFRGNSSLVLPTPESWPTLHVFVWLLILVPQLSFAGSRLVAPKSRSDFRIVFTGDHFHPRFIL